MGLDMNFLIDLIGRDKGISREAVIEAVESAMVSAARKKFGHGIDLEARYNEETGEIELFQFKRVVDEVKNPDLEISVEEAKEYDPEVQEGDEIGIKLDVGEFSRIAAQAAKQVIFQKVRDAERDRVYDEFKDRKGELVTGKVLRVERGGLYVLLGRAEAFLPSRELIPGDRYNQGDVIRAVIYDVRKTRKGPQVFLSRTHPLFLVRLLETEIPEVKDGIIKVVGAVRDPGERAKVAVYSEDPRIDPVGTCVGVKGTRIQSITDELRGERIDVIPWSPDSIQFISNALAPARIYKAYVDEDEKFIEVIVEDDQLSLAIGKRGQNVRLASRLTGWKIDIKGASKLSKLDSEIQQLFKKVGEEGSDKSGENG